MSKKAGNSINESQKKAIEFINGPLLVVAGAGTGKTKVITERIKYLIQKRDIKPDEILALTFTEKASAEMANRVGDIMPLGYEEPWIYTFHSFADRILRNEGLEIGLDTSYKVLSSTEQYLLIRQNLFKFGLSYFLPLGNPTKFIWGIIKFISRLQDEYISPENFLEFANGYKGDEEEKKRWLELANFYTNYQKIKLAKSKMDFGDLINWTVKLFKTRPVVLKKYQNQFKHVMVDEFQDTNYAQYELIKLLYPLNSDKDSNKKLQRSLLAVGDDSQCLPPHAKISTPLGTKEIRDIKAGDQVITAVGKGHTSISRVSRVFNRKRKTKFITFEIKGNEKITVTDNHKMFCFLPSFNNSNDWHFVYLMNQENLGWRVGVTNNLIGRLRLEHHADSIFALGSFSTDQEARFYEAYISAKYGLPTVPFLARPKQAISGKWLTKLFKDLGTNKKAEVLANDFGLELESPLFTVNGVTRGASKRTKINLHMCQRRYRSKTHEDGFVNNPSVTHQVHLETSNKSVIKVLEKNGFLLQNAKKGKRFRFSTENLAEAWKIAENLRAITGGFIDKKFVVGRYNTQHLPAKIVPASHVFPGMFLPVLVDKHIEYKAVISRNEKFEEIETYDLEIDKTHNFIANGVVVHNSIYKFRGAAVSNILEFMEDFPKAETITLLQNYRSSQNILDPAYKLIQNNNPDTLESKLNISKRLVSEIDKKGISPQVYELETMEDEVGVVVKTLMEIIAKEPQYNYKDFAILARANNHLDPFLLALRKSEIPYQLVGSRGLYDRDEIRNVIALLRVVVNSDDSISLYRVLNIPCFNIPGEIITGLFSFARLNKTPLWQVVKESENGQVKFTVEKILECQTNITKKMPSEIIYNLVRDIKFIDEFLKEETLENQLAIKNLDLFLNNVRNFEINYRIENKELPTLIDFVEYLNLMIEAGENPSQAEIEDIDTVNLLTVHASKGLEFPVVFMVNLVSDRFPTRDKSDQIPVPDELVKETLPIGDSHIQEERRLFYVGLTRAKKYLSLTYAKNYGGKRDKIRSGFVDELDLQTKSLSHNEIAKDKKQTALFGTESGFRDSKSQKLTGFVPESLSYSAIEAFEECPLKYKYGHVLKIPTPPSHALTFGTTVHNTLKDFHTGLLMGNKLTLADLYEMYENNWDPAGYIDQIHREEQFEHGKKLLKEYYKKNIDLKVKPEALEKWFNLRIGGIKFNGRIDRIDPLTDGGVEIIDYKTGSAKNLKDVDKNNQLSFYALGVTEFLGLKPEKLSLYFLETNEKFTTKRTPKQLEEIKAKIVGTIKEISKGEFRASPGRHCNYCSYNEICPYAFKG